MKQFVYTVAVISLVATACPLFGAGQDITVIYGAVILKDLGSSGIGVAIDSFDSVGLANGLVDEVFVLQSTNYPQVPSLYLAKARVCYAKDWLMITSLDAEPESIVLALHKPLRGDDKDLWSSGLPPLGKCEHPREGATQRLVFQGFGLSRNLITQGPLEGGLKHLNMLDILIDNNDNLVADCSKCPSGGPGSTSCSTTWCSVSCSSLWWACCDDTKCFCCRF